MPWHYYKCEKGLAQNMVGDIWWSIYSRRLSRGQHGYIADADWAWDAHLRHVANTIEPSVCGGDDVAFCPVTVTVDD